MRNPLKNKANALLLLFASGTAAFAACSGGDDASSAGGSSNDGGTRSDAAASSDATDDAAAAPDSGARVDVSGALYLSLSPGVFPPLSGRNVVIIGADGVVTKTVSGGGGAFTASGVATPYDVAIPQSSPDGSSVAQYYFAGITRANPALLVTDPTVPTHEITVTFDDNLAAGQEDSITGVSNIHSTGADAYAGTFDWSGGASLSVPMHVFHPVISARTPASYADLGIQTMNDGAQLSLGVLSLTTIASYVNVKMSTTLPSSYSYVNGSISLVTNADNQSCCQISYPDSGNTLGAVASVPVLAELDVSFVSVAAGSLGESAYSFKRYTNATVPTATVTLAPFAAPAAVEPASGATAVATSKVFTWSAFGTPTVYYVDIISPTSEWSIVSPNLSFDASRLALADMALTAATPYSWSVAATTQNGATMDEYVEAVPATVKYDVETYYASAQARSFTTE